MVITQVGTGGAVTITNYGGTINLVVDVVGYYTTTSTASSGDGFVPVTPARALDTRDGTGVQQSPLAANQSVTYQAGGNNGIPATGVSSVVFNMTTVNPSASGVVRVAAAGSGSASTPINYYTGQGITGMVVVPVSPSGAVTITNYGGTITLAVDIVGYYTTPGTASTGNGFVPVTPARALDTRSGAGALAPNQSVTYHVAGNNGVPATGATAVVFNMTAVAPSGTGVVRVAPGGTSNYIVPINYYTGQGITGRVITKLGADGTVTILNAGGTVNIAVDLVGYYTAENTATTSSYTYNGDGLRTSKTTNGATKAFTWDLGSGGLPLLESDTTNTYLYGVDDLPLEQINNTTGVISYFHHDQLGFTRILTDTTGNVTATQNYDPYGKPTLTTGTPSPLGYTGQYTDTDTGYLDLRARYYDPTTAQLTTIDPLQAISRSAYNYVSNDPLNDTDPSGDLCLSVHCLGGDLVHAANLAVATSANGIILQEASRETGKSLGQCVGGDYTIGLHGEASLCWQATPSGDHGFTGTFGGGPGGVGVNALSTFSASNAQILDDSSGRFVYGEIGAGAGVYGISGSLATGTNSCGRHIVQGTLGWAPGRRLGYGIEAPFSIAGGASQTYIGR